MREIGRQLGVETIVEGSVRQSGERLRVTAQLVRADDGSHLWSETFERPTGDLFAIEDEATGRAAPAGATLLSTAPAIFDWLGRADPDRRREWLALFRFTPEVQRISDRPRMQAFFAEAGLRGLPATGSGTPGPRRQP